MIIAIYARVSTKLQAETGYSLQTQVEACCEKARLLSSSCNILKFIDDGYSGSILERPALNKLRDRIKEKDIHTVICYDPDRLSRNLIHQLIITDEIKKYCTNLVFISMNFTQNPEGNLFYSIRGAFAEYERTKILERCMRGKKAKLRNNRLDNYHIYGYDFDQENATYIINEKEAAIIQQIYQWYISGIGTSNIVRKLQKSYGFKERYGKKYIWREYVVLHILKNNVYTGAFRVKYKGNFSVNIPIPAIISKNIFHQAEQQIVNNRTYMLRKHKPQLLTGLLFCKNCGSKLYACISKKSSCYKCSAQILPNLKEKIVCKSRSIPIKQLDEIVWESLLKICISPEKIHSYLQNSSSNINSELDNNLTMLDSKIAYYKQMQEKTLQLYINDLINEKSAETQLKSIKNMIKSILKKKKELLSKQDITSRKLSVKDIYTIFHKKKELSQKEKVTLLNKIIQRIEVKRTDQTICNNANKLKVNLCFIFK